jgi:TonB family protein
MFDSINCEGSLNPMTGFTSLVASMAVHAAIVGLLLAVPLIFIKGMPLEPLAYIGISPPMPVLKVPSPPPPSHDKSAGPPSGGVAIFKTNIPPKGIRTPIKLPKGIPAPKDEYPILVGVPGNVESLVAGSLVSDTGIALSIGNFDLPPLPEPPQKPTPARIGTLDPSKIVLKVIPEYPRLARLSRVEGEVRLEAVIDEEGNITKVRVLDGHQLLIDAAVRAVKQWKYTPTLQNGEPVPILATIRVNFKLH